MLSDFAVVNTGYGSFPMRVNHDGNKTLYFEADVPVGIFGKITITISKNDTPGQSITRSRVMDGLPVTIRVPVEIVAQLDELDYSISWQR